MQSEHPDPAGSEPGGTIGKYRIVGRIGSGGFGTVFEAWDPVIKRPVALNVCDAGRAVPHTKIPAARIIGDLQDVGSRKLVRTFQLQWPASSATNFS